MTEYPAIRDVNRCPSHPGEALADILLDVPKTKIEIADMLGISRQHLYDIINGNRSVTANIAVRLSKLFGGGALPWLNMQAAHDAWHAEREVDLSSIPTLVDA